MRFALSILAAVFCLGLAVGGFASSLGDLRHGTSFAQPTGGAIADLAPQRPSPALEKLFEGTQERASPQDWIRDDQILVYPDKIVINISGAQWSGFTDTNSMDPLLDAGANALQIQPQSPLQIREGDIISYTSPEGTIIHRVIGTGQDADGWYAITQGDNNGAPDREKVRWPQVRRVLIAVIY